MMQSLETRKALCDTLDKEELWVGREVAPLPSLSCLDPHTLSALAQPLSTGLGVRLTKIRGSLSPNSLLADGLSIRLSTLSCASTQLLLPSGKTPAHERPHAQLPLGAAHTPLLCNLTQSLVHTGRVKAIGCVNLHRT